MAARVLMRLYIVLAVVAAVAGLAWVYVAPPASLKADRDGVPYFTPAVVHPYTGEIMSVDQLVRHYRGEQP